MRISKPYPLNKRFYMLSLRLFMPSKHSVTLDGHKNEITWMGGTVYRLPMEIKKFNNTVLFIQMVANKADDVVHVEKLVDYIKPAAHADSDSSVPPVCPVVVCICSFASVSWRRSRTQVRFLGFYNGKIRKIMQVPQRQGKGGTHLWFW